MAEGLVLPLAKEDVAVIGHDRRASFALPGLLLATGALICAIVSLLVLLGLTPIKPETNIIIGSASINALFVLGLLFLIGREILRLLKARSRGSRRLPGCMCASWRCFRSLRSRLPFWWRFLPASRWMLASIAGFRCAHSRSSAHRSKWHRPMCWKTRAICRARRSRWPMTSSATASSTASTGPASSS